MYSEEWLPRRKGLKLSAKTVSSEDFEEGYDQEGSHLPACNLLYPYAGDRPKDKALSITQSDWEVINTHSSSGRKVGMQDAIKMIKYPKRQG